MVMATASKNLVLGDLVRSVGDVLALEREPGQMVRWVGGALRPFLGNPYLLTPEQRQPDPVRYRQHILHVDEGGRFSIIALVWLPGQATSVHDHLSWCVVGVHEGQECEVQYQVVSEGADQYLLAIGESTHKEGSVAVLQPPGDVHTVYNPGPKTAISIHVYGGDVRKHGSSIRCRYDLPVVETLPRSFRRYAAAG
jgi:predicted metal-dependent enzyme (double-stranded beta helix superfamily)